MERGDGRLLDHLPASLEVGQVLAQLLREGERDGRVQHAEFSVLLQLPAHTLLGRQGLVVACLSRLLHICRQLTCNRSRDLHTTPHVCDDWCLGYPVGVFLYSVCGGGLADKVVTAGGRQALQN